MKLIITPNSNKKRLLLEENNNKLSKLKSSFIFKNPMFLIDKKKSMTGVSSHTFYI